MSKSLYIVSKRPAQSWDIVEPTDEELFQMFNLEGKRVFFADATRYMEDRTVFDTRPDNHYWKNHYFVVFRNLPDNVNGFIGSISSSKYFLAGDQYTIIVCHNRWALPLPQTRRFDLVCVLNMREKQ